MTQFLETKLDELISKAFYYKLEQIYDIFCDSFGEENVELYKNHDFLALRTQLILSYWEMSEDNKSLHMVPYCTNDNTKYLITWFEELGETEETWDLLQYELKSINNYFYRFSSQYETYITVRFPRVTITNEEGQSTTIKNFFARVYMTIAGHYSSIHFNRSTYSYAHFVNNYMHSHISSINKLDFTRFVNTACFGNGPILDTMNNLSMEYDLDQWMQFCWDLEKYVSTESLQGGPYYKLAQCESIYSQSMYGYDRVMTSYLNGTAYIGKYLPGFIRHLIKSKVLKFRFHNNCFKIAHSNIEYAKIVSTEFLKWCIDSDLARNGWDLYALFANNILTKVKYTPTNVYKASININRETVQANVGKPVLTFKGVEYCLEIENIPDDQNLKESILLDWNTLYNISNILLLIINSNYGTTTVNKNEPEIPFTDF